ncbi:TetR/AcrR family transcriptional regulator C-terminal domain-containing protein [Lactobacillus sp. CC-MHH1034]|nr:TetR-like C-terminal domain-containing protein [Agrilactobacillus fermenti]MCD2255899.1 TetR/AcrR family transcriptional regulator C-terminal domain-containing protein [Agrilactobacillus fermenti]
MAGAVVSTMIQWLIQDCPESPAEMGKILNQMFVF